MSAKPLINGVSLSSPPFIEVEGLPNLRDLGGYATKDDRSVRRGVVWRSAAPSNKITDEGFKQIKELGLTGVYDVRSTTEIEKSEKAGKGGIIEFEGAKRVFAPVFTDKDYSPENLALRFSHYQSGTPEGFSKAYTDILLNAKSSYSQILRHIATSTPNQPKPLLLHCTAGKDRTGVLCAIILALCGVDDHTISKEYELTEKGLEAWRAIAKEVLMKSHKLDFNETTALNMLSARYESMMATLVMIREKFGGVEHYCKDVIELSQEEINAIKRNMVVDEPAIHKF